MVLGVADLDAAASRLEQAFGLTALPGGRHPGWGTANRIVPLGSCYLELVTVVDAAEAGASDFGRWVLAMLAGGPAVGWAVRTSDLASCRWPARDRGRRRVAYDGVRVARPLAHRRRGRGFGGAVVAVLHRVGRRGRPAGAYAGRAPGRPDVVGAARGRRRRRTAGLLARGTPARGPSGRCPTRRTHPDPEPAPHHSR